MPVNMLRTIARTLQGLEYCELTKAEHRIAHLLITAGYLCVDNYYVLQLKR